MEKVTLDIAKDWLMKKGIKKVFLSWRTPVFIQNSN